MNKMEKKTKLTMIKGAAGISRQSMDFTSMKSGRVFEDCRFKKKNDIGRMAIASYRKGEY